MSKKTIKQWCAEYEMHWYGQGRIGTISYDWKMTLGQGRTAVFSSAIESSEPETHQTNNRTVLVFPNPNSPRNQGKISRTKFLRITDWVEQCIMGNITP
jgi:hypothetical protein